MFQDDLCFKIKIEFTGAMLRLLLIRYRAVRKADGKIYAIKKVRLPSLSDKEKKNAVNEVRLLASIQHENVFSTYRGFYC